MVNVYGDDVPPNPNEDPTPPPTIEAADLGNKVGWENRRSIGSNTLYGQSPQALQTIVEQQNQQRALLEQQRKQQQQKAAQQLAAQQRQQVMQKYMGWERDVQQQRTYDEQARLDATQRPRYSDLKSLGDSTTQAIFSGNKLMQMMGFDVADDETMMGRTLEAQRIAALQTPGTRDERFFENERDKWNANSIELSSAYGNVGRKEGIPIPANPFENRGDVALALEKGGNAKDFTPATYGFNPNVGSMLGILPGGKGFQESEWDTAVARDKGRSAPAPVSFMDAINYQASQQGRMGVYGNLAGGVRDTAPNIPTGNRNAGTGELGMFTEQGAKRPFVSVDAPVQMSYEKPSGELEFFGLKATIPGLAFFQQGSVTESRTKTSNLPESTKYLRTESSILPNGTMMYTDFFETTGGKQKDTLTTVSPTPSGYDVMNQKVRDTLRLPSPEVGEQAVRVATVMNPLMTTPILVSMFTERFNPSQAGNARAIEGLITLRGQYTEFYENPILKPISMAAIGFGAGTLFKGAEAVSNAGRAAAAEKIISQGGLWRAAATTSDVAMRYTPKILGGLYAVDVAGRSTKWGTDFNPERVVTKAKGITMQEAVPMGFGFGLGQKAPSAIYNRAKISDINYKAAVQEGRTTGRVDYYAKQPITKPFEMAKIDYASFKQENSGGKLPDYLGMKVGNAYRSKVDIPIKAFMQEGFRAPKGAGNIPNAPEVGLPTFKGTTASRMGGSKIVGGRKVTSLSKEPSMRSMGISDRPITESGSPSKGFAASRSTDFRGEAKPMKPMRESSYGYQGKQAAGQISILSEQLAPLEGTTHGRMPVQRMQTPYSMFRNSPLRMGVVSELEPELEFSQTSRTRKSLSYLENPIFASNSMSGLRQGSRYTTETMVQQRARQGQALSLFSELKSTVPQQQQAVRNTIRQQDSLYGMDISRITGIDQTTRQRTDQSRWLRELQGIKTSSMQRTWQDQIQRPWQDTITKPITTTVPATGILPFFGGGGAGGMFGGRKGKIAWREKIPMQNVLLTKGKPLIKMPSMNLPKQRPAKKTSRKKSMWGW